MRHSRLIVCAVIGIATARIGAQTPIAPRSPGFEQVPLFPTRQNVFDIPFQIDDPIPGQEPVEVQLHVSDDHGATWRQVAKVAPSEARFSFHAPNDGEYWFLVRTLNRAGRLLPEKPPAPELRVLVDTEPPLTELHCSRGNDGEITCTFKTGDPHLKLDTLQLAYQGMNAQTVWQPVPISAPEQGSDGKWSGRVTFTPTWAHPPIYVRLEVSDAAGNRATAQQQVAMPGETFSRPNSLPITKADAASVRDATSNSTSRTPTQSASQSSASDAKSSAAADSGVLPGLPNGRAWPAVSTPLPDRMPPREAIGPPGIPPSMPHAFPSERIPSKSGELVPAESAPPNRYAPASTPDRMTTGSSPEVSADVLPQGEVGQAESLPIPEPEPRTAKEPTAPSVDPNRARTLQPSNDDARGPSFSAESGPKLIDDAGKDSERTDASPDGRRDDATSGAKPRLVNSRRFELDYDIESIGPAGVAKVELWMTEDGGRSWRSFGVDPDSASPYLVSVDHEGTFGFRMLIESTTGLRSSRPESGDLPELCVRVDITKPTAKILSAVPGTGEQAGELRIEWEAADDVLASRPISLAFADRIEGPWATIASGLPNLGHYSWRLDNRTPERLFLKLEVRDEAGNVGTFITPSPVSLERLRPQGKIRGVRPLTESARLRLPAEIPPR